jgi:hypothetical protein
VRQVQQPGPPPVYGRRFLRGGECVHVLFPPLRPLRLVTALLMDCTRSADSRTRDGHE